MPYSDPKKVIEYQRYYRQEKLTPLKRKEYSDRFQNTRLDRRATWRKYMYKQLYGMTQAGYDQLLEKQDNKCAICKCPPKPGKVLCVDHCHGTGKVRGLLCHGCNTSIGKLGIDGLEVALEYLKNFYRRIFDQVR